MFELVSKIIPPGLLFGLALYCGVCFIWLQPLVEKRLADKIYIPQCEAGVRDARLGAEQQLESERNRRQAVLDAYKGLMGELAEIPGASEILTLSGGFAPTEAPTIEKPNLIDESTLCGCAAATAFEEIKMPMLLHVASLRAYHPHALDTLPHSIGRIVSTGKCGMLRSGESND